MTHPYYPELGYWTLGGHIPDPTPLIDQAKEGERIGLSTVWISERPGTKDIGVLSGAAFRSAKLDDCFRAYSEPANAQPAGGCLICFHNDADDGQQVYSGYGAWPA
ncbi:MAG: hypothetical protein R3E73_10925 [Porticoccaceae bacterium]